MLNPLFVQRLIAQRTREARLRRMELPLLLLMLFLLLLPGAHAQQTPATSPPQPSVPGISPNPTPPDITLQRMNEKMARLRNSERQKQIIADSAQILKLAQQLNSDVAKSNKYTLSIPVVEEAEKIEKLAKAIKEKMKEGY